MKQILSVLVLLIMFGTTLFAEPVTGGSVREAGNKICPVSGGAVSGTSFVDHEGVRYGICCAACAKKFQANPEKYLALMAEKEGKSGAEEVMQEGSEHADHTM